MDLTPFTDIVLPLERSKPRMKVAPLLVMAILVCLIVAMTFHSSSHTRRMSFTPASALAQQVALRDSLPKPAPDPDIWDEERDGNGALEIEDMNGEGTIFVDTPTNTRILCVSRSSCIKLPKPKLPLTVTPTGMTTSKP